MKSVNPYLNFNGNCEEAFEFYQSIFSGELQITRFKDMADNMGATGEDLDKIANIVLPLTGGTVLMGTDVLDSMDQKLTIGNNFSITLEVDSADEAEELFNKLSDGGKIQIPLVETEWAERYGALTDKFGIQWMVNYTGDVDFA
ncbi:VOC family protein [Aliifodinibius salicampi]|uniref:VOC family protein n=1 Tax=Fodinibius salicampi TaxID=1920655 RepID=A0ABT3PXE9_9BACT|nr:VOC family protein [Fodinibius salicampi]MCW9712518.1 VOC family protein [Fodinibius salicampi]